MRDISFGQYYPSNSPLHRLDPRIKILSVVIYVVAIFFIDGYTGFLAVFVLLAIAVGLSKVPLKLIFRSIRPLLFLIIFSLTVNLFFTTGAAETVIVAFPFKNYAFWRIEITDKIFEWWQIGMYWSGINTAVKLTLRLAFLVMGPSLLTLTTTPVTLTDGIESLMKPLRIIRFPVHELAIIMSIALRLIPTIMEETDKIILAQKARCAAFDSRNLFKKARALLPVLIPLFVSSLRRAEDLAYAMDSRCYHGSVGRTKMKVLKLAWTDILFFAGMLLMLIVFLFLRYNTAWFDWAWLEMINIQIIYN